MACHPQDGLPGPATGCSSAMISGAYLRIWLRRTSIWRTMLSSQVRRAFASASPRSSAVPPARSVNPDMYFAPLRISHTLSPQEVGCQVPCAFQRLSLRASMLIVVSSAFLIPRRSVRLRRVLSSVSTHCSMMLRWLGRLFSYPRLLRMSSRASETGRGIPTMIQQGIRGRGLRVVARKGDALELHAGDFKELLASSPMPRLKI